MAEIFVCICAVVALIKGFYQSFQDLFMKRRFPFQDEVEDVAKMDRVMQLIPPRYRPKKSLDDYMSNVIHSFYSNNKHFQFVHHTLSLITYNSTCHFLFISHPINGHTPTTQPHSLSTSQPLHHCLICTYTCLPVLKVICAKNSLTKKVPGKKKKPETKLKPKKRKKKVPITPSWL